MVTFQFVPASDEQKSIMQEFRDEYQKLYDKISTLDISRGLDKAKTKLEESNMWLNKAITRND